MSQSQTKKRRRPAAATDDSAAVEEGPQFLPPLKPNRTLFYISTLLVAACLTTLLVLYLTTAPQLRPRGSAPNAPWPTDMTSAQEREHSGPSAPEAGRSPPPNANPQSVPR